MVLREKLQLEMKNQTKTLRQPVSNYASSRWQSFLVGRLPFFIEAGVEEVRS